MKYRVFAVTALLLPILFIGGCAYDTSTGEAHNPQKETLEIGNSDGVDLTIHLTHPQQFSIAVTNEGAGNPTTMRIPFEATTLHIFGLPQGHSLSYSGPPPASLGFQQFYKCMGQDVKVLGDTGSAQACLDACKRHGGTGCWWLDGSGGFARECRICTASAPLKSHWSNDWGLTLNPQGIQP